MSAPPCWSFRTVSLDLRKSSAQSYFSWECKASEQAHLYPKKSKQTPNKRAELIRTPKKSKQTYKQAHSCPRSPSHAQCKVQTPLPNIRNNRAYILHGRSPSNRITVAAARGTQAKLTQILNSIDWVYLSCLLSLSRLHTKGS